MQRRAGANLRACKRRSDAARHRRHPCAAPRTGPRAGLSPRFGVRHRLRAPRLAGGRGRARQRRGSSAGGAGTLAAARPAHRRVRLGRGRCESASRACCASAASARAAWSFSSSWAALPSRSPRARPRSGGAGCRSAALRRRRMPRAAWHARALALSRAAGRGLRARRPAHQARRARRHAGRARARPRAAAVGRRSRQRIDRHRVAARRAGRARRRRRGACRARAARRSQCALARRAGARRPRGRSAGSPVGTARARCDLHRRRADCSGPARALLGGAAARRAPGSQRRDTRGRAGAQPRHGRSTAASSRASTSSHAEPVGGFTAWRAQLPIVQWSVRKEGA